MRGQVSQVKSHTADLFWRFDSDACVDFYYCLILRGKLNNIVQIWNTEIHFIVSLKKRQGAIHNAGKTNLCKFVLC